MDVKTPYCGNRFAIYTYIKLLCAHLKLTQCFMSIMSQLKKSTKIQQIFFENIIYAL